MTRLKRRLIRWIIALLLHVVARIEVQGLERLRSIKGKAIVASNHLGRLDAGIALLLVPRDDVIIVVAEKYKQYAIFRWLVRHLDMLWLERFEADLGTLKEVLRRLDRGGILLIAPEGTRSHTEALIEGKPGVAYIAAKSGAEIVPAAVLGTEDRLVKRAFSQLRRPKIRIEVGESFSIPPLPRQNRDAFLRAQTDEIMSRIAVLLPESHRGVYEKHPRVSELLVG